MTLVRGEKKKRSCYMPFCAISGINLSEAESYDHRNDNISHNFTEFSNKYIQNETFWCVISSVASLLCLL